MKRRVLPSLNALRTFEAVARHNSFTRAAEELNVTQSAASRLVHSLEEYLEVPLFTRRSRRIQLTDQGTYYSRLVSRSLDLLEAGTVELMSSRAGQGTLSVGMLPTFGTRWLLPRLPSFQKLHPDISVNVVSSDGDLDFTRERIDIAIRFGHGEWSDALVDPLMGEEVQVVCSPLLVDPDRPLDHPSDITRYRLIEHSTRPHSWEHWFRSVGAELSPIDWGPRLEHFFMIIEAAKAGLGMALLPTFLIEEELRTGSLIAPFKTRVSGPGAYYLVTPQTKAGLPRVTAFRRWVLGQLA
ncbi:transcriptional regulator GcvA [Devosia aurantiaca]|uniref:Transcriptional regulator GcvA n=1 Tax=Devosia aurantiaca TaxID=2714858 RepID=A0A6M1SW43_9HYPH|nr:transcriptional regulator GcvA [Devosia aurantiaca]NGP19195.1 transcriptional regulator GcvA [Devosia aurantiaca]